MDGDERVACLNAEIAYLKGLAEGHRYAIAKKDTEIERLRAELSGVHALVDGGDLKERARDLGTLRLKLVEKDMEIERLTQILRKSNA